MHHGNVIVENLPYEQFIQRYDREGTFFYCDPPYYKLPYYKHNLNIEDFKKLADSLKTIKGKFILSINDHSDIREIFNQFNIKTVDIRYSVGGAAKSKKTSELLYYNF